MREYEFLVVGFLQYSHLLVFGRPQILPEICTLSARLIGDSRRFNFTHAGGFWIF